MERKKVVKFVAIKTEKKPVKVKFKTKSGISVSFNAIKTIKKPVNVKFKARKKIK